MLRSARAATMVSIAEQLIVDEMGQLVGFATAAGVLVGIEMFGSHVRNDVQLHLFVLPTVLLHIGVEYTVVVSCLTSLHAIAWCLTCQNDWGSLRISPTLNCPQGTLIASLILFSTYLLMFLV